MANPNPGQITDEMWSVWERAHQLEPSTQLGGFVSNSGEGYHNTINTLLNKNPGDYSIQDPVDRDGPRDKAAAFDWTFPEAQNGDYRRINLYSQRLMASGQDVNDPRLDGLREWYGNTSNFVTGWDCRYLRTITSDDSHLWHIHVSFTRTHITNIEVMNNLISVLAGETLDEWRNGADDMSWQEHFTGVNSQGTPYDFTAKEMLTGTNEAAWKAVQTVEALKADVAVLKDKIDKLAVGGIDMQNLANLVSKQVNDELARRQQS